MTRLIGSIIRHHVLANMVMVLILLAGVLAARSMLREAFPEIEPFAFTVTVAYPGADVEEVEEGVSRKIEEAIDGMEGVDRYSTVSREGISVTTIEINDSYPMSKAREQIDNAVGAISTFPQAAERPVVAEIIPRDDALLLTLWGNMDERTRKETAETIKDELQALPAISQVDVLGVRDYEIFIEVSENRLRQYGLTFSDVTDALKRGSVNLAGGFMQTGTEQIGIRVSGRKYTGQELEKIVVIAGPQGEIITLDHLAAIRDGFTEDPVIARFNGQPAVLLRLVKTPGGDSIAIAEAGHRYVAEKSAELPEGIRLTAWSDGSLVIRDRLSITFRNGVLGLCIVIACLWFFLNSRLSFWVSMGIPISLAGSLVILWISGLTLNSVTLFGLVMVTGIVVDDAIIVGEAILLRRTMGDGPLRAATNGVLEVGLPVFAAVLTTIIAFMPMGFTSGVMGQIMATMAVAVIGALAVSLVEALFILPAHLQHLRMPSTSDGEQGPTSIGRRFRRSVDRILEVLIDGVYVPFIRHTLNYRYVTLCCGLAIVILTYGLASGGYVKFTPFPSWDDNQIEARVEFPRGTQESVTAAAMERTEQGLAQFIATQEAEHGPGLVENVFSVVGDEGTHTGFIRVQLRHSNNREVHSQDILAGWQRAVGTIPGALSQTFASVDGGPGGRPIELWIQGTRADMLQEVSEAIKDRLRTYDGVYQIEDSFRPGKREITLDIRPEARPLGITLGDLAEQVYAGFYGQQADRIQRGRDDVRIKVRYTPEERSGLAELQSVRIRTSQGMEVPLLAVADFNFGASPAVIERADGRRRVAVSAEVDEKRANAQEILADMTQNFLPNLLQNYPSVSLSFEGAQQDTRESLGSLLRLFPIAMIGIFLVVATIFRSYVQPIVIMLTVPFGVIGAVLGHVALGWPLSMFSVFGMMALTGVVVNDAIVMIEAVNGLLAKGVPVMEAIVGGGRRRFRAILLTTLSTIGALIPLIIEDDLSAQPLNPMALSVACGVGFATVLTLVYIPCLLAILNDFRRLTFAVTHRRWPSRDEVEPARYRGRPLFEEE